jgi:hypothetical protein
MSWRILSGLLLAVISANTGATTSERDLGRWLEREAVPFVQQQLLEHPRFKGETVMFIVLDKNAPATSSNQLALSLRDRLLSAALDTPGVTIGWRQGRSDAHHGTETVDCTRDDVHYYIGLELSRQLDDSYSLSLRALDMEDRSWVTGFGKSWRGSLSMSQRRAVRQIKVDQTFIGGRNVPFAADQNDLLARHLAHELSCALLRQTSGDYIVSTEPLEQSAGDLDNTIELVSNNIAANSAIDLTTKPNEANAEFSGKAHKIDGSLFQYWLTVTPMQADSELSSLSVSAYVLRPNQRLASVSFGGAIIDMPKSENASLIGHRSFADDAVVFFVEHQPHFGLVRIDSGQCRDRTAAKIVRAGDPLHFPVAYAHPRNSEAIEIDDWYIEPARDTYYAIAISDEKAARKIANHIDYLPMRCGAPTRPGLTGAALRAWLDDFSRLVAKSAQHIDWRAIEIRDVL